MAVAENLEILLPVHADFVAGIDAHHGHLAQHRQHVVGLAVGILGHIIADAVHLLLDELALGGDRHILQLDVVKHAQQRVVDPIIVISGSCRHLTRQFQRGGIAHLTVSAVQGVAVDGRLVAGADLGNLDVEFAVLNGSLGLDAVSLLLGRVECGGNLIALLLEVQHNGHGVRTSRDTSFPSAVQVLCHCGEARHDDHGDTQ